MDNQLQVVVAAAGSSRRMGEKVNKPYLLLKGKPLLAYFIAVLENSSLVKDIIIVVRQQEVEYCKREIAEKYGFKKIKAIIVGGAERQDSVFCGLQALAPDTAWVAVHDGARPFLTDDLWVKLVEAASEYGAAVPGLPLRDTLKEIDRDGFIIKTLERGSIVAVQTPQVFAYQKLLSAYLKARDDNFMATDDAAIYEKYAGPVKIITGDAANVKITLPEDLIWAEAFLKARAGKI